MSKLKTTIRATLVAAVLAAAALSPALIRYSSLNPIYSPAQSENGEVLSKVALPPTTAKAGLPRRLQIPVIDVDVPIQPMGLLPNGDMEAPPNGARYTSWYKFGPRPGDSGSAVIAGHYGWMNSVPAVFNGLHKLQPGDKLYVVDEKGSATTFVVRESRSYDPEADASDVFYSRDTEPHLNLITCEGAWDETRQTYAERLVVFADKR